MLVETRDDNAATHQQRSASLTRMGRDGVETFGATETLKAINICVDSRSSPSQPR